VIDRLRSPVLEMEMGANSVPRRSASRNSFTSDPSTPGELTRTTDSHAQLQRSPLFIIYDRLTYYIFCFCLADINTRTTCVPSYPLTSIMSLPLPLAAARLPPYFLTTDHRQRSLAQLRSKHSGLEKYIYLNGVKERDPNLFYEILLGNMLEIIPILYTPTVRFPFLFLGRGPFISDQHLITVTFSVGWGCLLELLAHLAPSGRSLCDH